MNIMSINDVSWISKIFRPMLGAIDSLIYSLIKWILQGIFMLSDLTVNAEFVQTIYRRIYVMISIFMIFKLTVSFIKYLVSPDAMTDKEQGVGKLVIRSVTMLAILVMLPIIFFGSLDELGGKTLLNSLQSGVINTLPKVILGAERNAEDTSFDDQVAANGENMAVTMLTSLFYAGEGSSDDIQSVEDFSTHLMEEGENKTYKYTYMWPLTTVAGVALVVILLGIAIDIAIRVFKLMILQVMAPIPVISYIDPKSSKNGAFNSWIKSFVSTYIDIFVKLAIVFILLLIIGNLFPKDRPGIFGDQIDKISTFSVRNFVRVFLIIGLFKFAKDAPKFLKDALGIKDSGGGGLFGGLGALGAAAGTVGGGLAGLVGGAAGGIASAGAAGGNLASKFLKGTGGAISGAVRGGTQGFSGAKKGNALKGIGGAIAAQNAATQRNLAAAAAGSTWAGRMGARKDLFLKGQTAADVDEANIQDYNNLVSDIGNFKSALEAGADKTDEMIKVNGNNVNLKQFKGTLAAANSGDANAIAALQGYGFSRKVTKTVRDSSGNMVNVTTTEGDLAAANAGAKGFEKAFQNEYYNAIQSKTIKIGADEEAIISAQSVVDRDLASAEILDSGGNRITGIHSSDVLDADGNVTGHKANTGEIEGIAKTNINSIKSDKKYRSNKANKEAIKRNGK